MTVGDGSSNLSGLLIDAQFGFKEGVFNPEKGYKPIPEFLLGRLQGRNFDLIYLENWASGGV